MEELSLVLAKFWGGFFVIFGTLFIVRRQLAKTIEMTDDKKFVIATGYITLLMGLATVAMHNVWGMSWETLITVLGWSTLMKGIMKVGFSDWINKTAQHFKKNQLVSAGFLVLMGAFLLWKGSVG